MVVLVVAVLAIDERLLVVTLVLTVGGRRAPDRVTGGGYIEEGDGGGGIDVCFLLGPCTPEDEAAAFVLTNGAGELDDGAIASDTEDTLVECALAIAPAEPLRPVRTGIGTGLELTSFF